MASTISSRRAFVGILALGITLCCFGPSSAAEENAAPAVTLGVTVAEKETAETPLKAMGAPTLKGRRCVIVTAVDPNGPSVGRLAVNNAIVSIGDILTPDVATLNNALKELQAGLEVEIKGLYLSRGEDGKPRWTPGNVRVRLAAVAAKPPPKQDKPTPPQTQASSPAGTEPTQPVKSDGTAKAPPATSTPAESGKPQPAGVAVEAKIAPRAAGQSTEAESGQKDEVLTAEWFPFHAGAKAEYKITGMLDMMQEWSYQDREGVRYIAPRMTEMGGHSVSNGQEGYEYLVEGNDVVLKKGSDRECVIKISARVGETWKCGDYTYSFKGFDTFDIFLYKGADPGPRKCAVIRVESRVQGKLATIEERFYAKGFGLMGKKGYTPDGKLVTHWVATKCADERMTASERIFWGVDGREKAALSDSLPAKTPTAEQAFDPADVEECARVEQQFDVCGANARRLDAEGDKKGGLAELRKAGDLALKSIAFHEKYKSRKAEFRAAVEKAKAALK